VFTVVFTQAARAELIEAQDWYEGEAGGLGRRFRQAAATLCNGKTEPKARHSAPENIIEASET
jgi:hypothetical protein